MKIWLAYKFRGTNQEELRKQLEELVALLKENGHDAITMLKDIQNWQSDSMSKVDAVKKAYQLYKECDAALCIYSSTDPSEGRGFDAGYFAGAGKPTIMAIHKETAIPYTEALYAENPANKKAHIPRIIRYETIADIANALKEIK